MVPEGSAPGPVAVAAASRGGEGGGAAGAEERPLPAGLRQHLKTLRHPCLLRFLSCTVEADGIHLVTERVQPLGVALEALSPAEVCAGIYDVLLALVFLHDRGHLTHNNVCLSSVFVSEDGHWKLGGMETVCAVPQATPEFLRSIQSVRDPASVPPEETSPGFTTLPASHGHARDAYSFGMLVERVLTVLSEQVSAGALPSFRQTLRPALLNPSPQGRPALRTLLSHDFFRNDFLEIVNFLQSLTLKSEEEKAEFFKFLLDRVSGLSEELIASRLVPLLLNQLVFAEPVAVKSFLPHLLGPKQAPAQGEAPRLLSPALFRSRVVPVLLRLFEVHEEHVRVVLLSHLEAYAGHLPREQLRTVVLPQVLLGLRDTSDSIVAITLHSLAVLVSLLGPEVVVGGERTKIFKRTAPSFTKTVDLSPEGDHFTQPVKFPLNGISDVKSTSGDTDSFPGPDEWPDWGEPGEPGDRAGSTQAGPTKAPRPSEEETWGDAGLHSGPEEPALAGEATLLQPCPPQKPELTQRGDHPSLAGPPKTLSHDRRPKLPSELGLGEEFTIHVKQQPARDPELDWFADMTPDIKPSAALVLPELTAQMVAPSKATASPVVFSSKFAAAATVEVPAEGWGEGELGWDDSSW
ncbi:protein-associating with the carboxyl-terminal domain of ezrin isoform X2 [Manis pentadactyla]|uniref:protein-associating with the carboxyl-terminal domain of ezrin isoform X2 n=1 Tax=Manis pentadactyla TaxID=143292 RepID=UPI00255C76B6|nr:protein-associating with the carboxyl-terminal domain of ezrin isoform X2 [Manis pentadactyla]